MSAIVQVATVDVAPEGWLPIPAAASRMGCDQGNLRRRCSLHWSELRLAVKVAGEWFVNPDADERLRGLESEEMKDARQYGELRREGYNAKTLKRAWAILELVRLFFQFRGHGRSEDALRVEFVNKCRADGTFRTKGLKEYAPDTFRKLADAYRIHGLRGLVRKPYADRGSRAFGAKAIARFIEVMRVGHGIGVKLALSQVFGEVIKAGLRGDPEWAIPSTRTAERYWNEQIPHPAKVLIAEGPNKFRAKCIPKIARNPHEDYAAGELLVLDERNYDFMVREFGDGKWIRYRPKLTALRCAVSGMIVGWYVGKRANSDTILATMKRAFLAMETVCREMIFDNGPGEKVIGGKRKWDSLDEKRLTQAAELLGITVHFARVRAPWVKPIESSFSGLKDFDRFQVSFTGGSPAEKPWDFEKWTKANIMELATIDEIREQFSAFLDAYHEEPRRSRITQGLSARQAFRQFYTTRPRSIDKDTLDLLCRKMVGPMKVGRDGVRHDGLRYGTFDDAVFKLQGQTVWLLVDAIDRDSVILCQQDGPPITTANVDRALGYKSEEVRDRIAHQKRCERSVKQYYPSRDYLLKTPAAQIIERRKLAAQARQIPDSQIPPRLSPESVELVRPDVAAAAGKVKRAAGAETLRRLSAANAAAEAVNRPRRVDFEKLAASGEAIGDDDGSRPKRVVDWSQMANGDET